MSTDTSLAFQEFSEMTDSSFFFFYKQLTHLWNKRSVSWVEMCLWLASVWLSLTTTLYSGNNLSKTGDKKFHFTAAGRLKGSTPGQDEFSGARDCPFIGIMGCHSAVCVGRTAGGLWMGMSQMNENLVVFVGQTCVNQDNMLLHTTFIPAHISVLEQFLLV